MPLFPVGDIHVGVFSGFYIPVNPQCGRDDEDEKNRDKFRRRLFPGIIFITVVEKVDNQGNQWIEEIRNHFRYVDNKRVLGFHSAKFRPQDTKIIIFRKLSILNRIQW